MELSNLSIDELNQLQYAEEKKYAELIRGDIHLYSLNDSAVRAFTDLGVDTLTVPVELTRGEAAGLLPGSYDCVVYGHIPLMVSAQCLNKTLTGCTHKPGQHKIIDRKGTAFRYRNECGECVNTIYNSVPLFLDRSEAETLPIGVRSLRLMFTIEDAKSTSACIETWLSGVRPQSFTRGHWIHGVE